MFIFPHVPLGIPYLLTHYYCFIYLLFFSLKNRERHYSKFKSFYLCENFRLFVLFTGYRTENTRVQQGRVQIWLSSHDSIGLNFLQQTGTLPGNTPRQRSSMLTQSLNLRLKNQVLHFLYWTAPQLPDGSEPKQLLCRNVYS